MIGQHDAARADPDRVRRIADMREDHGSGTARDAFHRMVLGHPIPRAAEAFGGLRQPGRGFEGFRKGSAFTDGNEIEDRESSHSAGAICARYSRA